MRIFAIPWHSTSSDLSRQSYSPSHFHVDGIHSPLLQGNMELSAPHAAYSEMTVDESDKYIRTELHLQFNYFINILNSSISVLNLYFGSIRCSIISKPKETGIPRLNLKTKETLPTNELGYLHYSGKKQYLPWMDRREHVISIHFKNEITAVSFIRSVRTIFIFITHPRFLDTFLTFLA